MWNGFYFNPTNANTIQRVRWKTVGNALIDDGNESKDYLSKIIFTKNQNISMQHRLCLLLNLIVYKSSCWQGSTVELLPAYLTFITLSSLRLLDLTKVLDASRPADPWLQSRFWWAIKTSGVENYYVL